MAVTPESQLPYIDTTTLVDHLATRVHKMVAEFDANTSCSQQDHASRIAELESRLRTIEYDRDSWRGATGVLQQEKAKLRGQLDEANRTVANLQDHYASRTSRIAELIAERDQLKAQVRELTPRGAALAEARDQLARLEATLCVERDTIRQLQAANQRQDEVQAELHRKLKGVTASRDEWRTIADQSDSRTRRQVSLLGSLLNELFGAYVSDDDGVTVVTSHDLGVARSFTLEWTKVEADTTGNEVTHTPMATQVTAVTVPR